MRRRCSGTMQGAIWPRLHAIVVLSCVAAVTGVGLRAPVTGATQRHTGLAAHYRATLAPSLPACDGPHDLVVDSEQVSLLGTHTFDRVCVRHQGVLRLSGHLYVGILYVDSTGRISGDGRPGGILPPNTCHPDGSNGGSAIIIAHVALIFGVISVAGGAGYQAAATQCDDLVAATDSFDGGRGGDGGRLTFDALQLTLGSPLSAVGGAGGASYTEDLDFHSSGGNGGRGGTITIATLHPSVAQLVRLARVDGGKGGPAGSNGHPGRQGGAGHVMIRSLTAAETRLIPALPPLPVATLGPAPRRLAVRADLMRRWHARCGAHDLEVPVAGDRTLSGRHHYAHVCIDDAGTLEVHGSLTLVAQTIIVDQHAVIEADGIEDTAARGFTDGRYDDRGRCSPLHPLPHAGVSGAQGESYQDVDNHNDDNYATITPTGGLGGGAITLIAHQIDIAGGLSAQGGTGSQGSDSLTISPDLGATEPTRGAGGGSGGGILIVADDLQLQGSVSVAGGPGGAGGVFEHDYAADGGQPGSPGCITILANTLRTPTAALPVVGPTLLGRVGAVKELPSP